MKLGIDKAGRQGVAVVALRNSGHLGRIGDWAEMAARAGKVSLHFVNTSGGGILVAPFGGTQRRLSANPIAAGVPVANGPPIILDISTCTIAEGKIKVAFNKGAKVPDGCILDGEGRPTNDPKAFYASPPGAILPLGGHKGYGLSVIAEVLAGALTGGACSHFGVDRVANNMLSIILDPAFFQSAGRLRRGDRRLHHPRQELEDRDAGRRDPHARRARGADPRPQAARGNRDRRHDMGPDRRHGRVARRCRRVDRAMMTLFGLKLVDLAMIAAYFAVVMAIGFWSARKVKTEDGFLPGRPAVRQGPLDHALAVHRHAQRDGRAGGRRDGPRRAGGIWYQWMWLFSTPFYWLMAPVTRRLRVTTTGDFFRIRYGRSLEMLYALVGLFYFGLSIALLLRGAGAAISGATGGAVPTEASVIALAVLFSTYVMAGGLVAAVYTDLLQGVMIIVLSLMLVPAGLGVVGGLAGLHDKLARRCLRSPPLRGARRRPLVCRHDVGLGPGGLRRPAARHDRDRLGQDRDRSPGRHGLRQLHQAAADDRLGLHRPDRAGRVSRGASPGSTRAAGRLARPARPCLAGRSSISWATAGAG